MLVIIKYFIAGIFIFTILFITSILWPKFRSDQKPEFLQKIYSVGINTSPGQKLSNVLGVSIDKKIEPVSVTKLSEEMIKNTQNRIINYTQNIAVTYAVRQLLGLYANLEDNQKKELKDIICQLKESTSASAIQSK
jgi:hypothetical protein